MLFCRQGYVENMLREFDHVLTLRVRMPIDGDVLCNKRNFIYKIAHYNKARLGGGQCVVGWLLKPFKAF